jgi:nucleoside-diphosphate kinase
MEKTLVIVKPNGVKAGLTGKIIARYENSRLAISAIKIKKLTIDDVRGFYAEHVEKPFFAELAAYMTSGPVVLIALQGEDAVKKARVLNGATNPANAEPGTIRFDYAKTITENVVHSSDSTQSAEREIGFWFNSSEIVSVTTADFRI